LSLRIEGVIMTSLARATGLALLRNADVRTLQAILDHRL